MQWIDIFENFDEEVLCMIKKISMIYFYVKNVDNDLYCITRPHLTWSDLTSLINVGPQYSFDSYNHQAVTAGTGYVQWW